MDSRLGVLVFPLVLCLVAHAGNFAYGTPPGTGVPLRVPVSRPPSQPAVAHPLSAQYCPPATSDPQVMGARQSLRHAWYPPARPQGQPSDPAPSFTPTNALFSLLTIPFKLVSVATSTAPRQAVPTGPPPGYAPMMPPGGVPAAGPAPRHPLPVRWSHTARPYSSVH